LSLAATGQPSSGEGSSRLRTRTVAVVALPGTITSLNNGATEYLKAADLIARSSGIDRVKLVPYDFSDVPGYALTPQHWIDLSRLVQQLLTIHDAIVVAHGTNTLEETAYFLGLTTSGQSKPIVVTGAMRTPGSIGADGEQNLEDAIRVAAASDSYEQGVLVVFNQSVWSARDCVKIHTYRIDAFASPDRAPLGEVTPGGIVRLYRSQPKRVRKAPWTAIPLDKLPRVDIVTSYVGADGVLVDAAVAAGAAGIVSAGSGAGFPTPAEERALMAAVDRDVAVCIATRVLAGPVDPVQLPAGRFVLAGLPPLKARILLSLALTIERDIAALQELFNEFG
jgi:L-asparaginase